MTEMDQHCSGCEGSDCSPVSQRSRLAELMAAGRATCSVEEAAAILGVGRSTAYAAAHDGSLPSLRVSHRLLVPVARLAEMVQGGRGAACHGERD
jgi:excisionase family DNA binding protein